MSPTEFGVIVTERSLMRQRLRLYTGDENVATLAEPEVTITLGEITQILTDAANSRRAWVKDFAEDELRISSDLYEVLQTYWNMRPSA